MEAYEKTYFYIKGFATAAKMEQTKRALPIAERAHEGVFRNGGDPYVTHCLRVAASLLALGITDDEVIAAALLHDVVEDTKITILQLKDMGINDRTCRIIQLVTKPEKDKYDSETYYNAIAEEVGAILVKVSDRCHNCSTMAVFKPDRLRRYIDETNRYFTPLIHNARCIYPQYEDALFSYKYQITSLCELAEELLRQIESFKVNSEPNSLGSVI